jgi:hypothetical protein
LGGSTESIRGITCWPMAEKLTATRIEMAKDSFIGISVLVAFNAMSIPCGIQGVCIVSYSDSRMSAKRSPMPGQLENRHGL